MKQHFLSIDISLNPYRQFVDDLVELARSGASGYTCVANVHMLVEAANDKNFASIVNNATICTPDGMPLVWGLKLLYGIEQDRVAGMDLLPDLLKETERHGIPVYFYGGTPETIDNTRYYISQHYPQLKVAGMYSPPFRVIDQDEEREIVNNINNGRPGIVFVALGCPKQEKWMAAMKDRISATMIGIGGALPVMIGMQKRAPSWARNAGLEWLYRLAQEPKRLFKRYAVTNSKFLWLLFKTKMRLLSKSGN
ncbi:WecB/TagA/CpsF family glycosyltransferase [Dyadobacter aurulentus]|uniref:WecB/TagA/CpsF family glycosyltransferase n=1 Tax=Dyadobacter sp. UC 10 TaxID=2605428 RepID=UPI0011F10D6F|nr:WecB/TagA/CpsF family glycosyltransferase [Dyadobacter sp. UC 10]KAA0988878.1 WecB/TagA/CpsF family glycosyltransferase [Dyadobacter sp. UC 10]